MTENNESLAVRENSNTGAISPFSSIASFVDAQRMMAPLMNSTMVPECYRATIYDAKAGHTVENTAGLGNCLIAAEIAMRIREPLPLVMQHMVPIGGRPSWDAAYIAGKITASGRFSALRYDEGDLGAIDIEVTTWEWSGGKKHPQKSVVHLDHNLTCKAWAVEAASKQRVDGVTITLEMAVREGWYGRNPKWQSMPQNMLRKRAASFFGRDYVSDLLCGMPCREELEESIDVEAFSVPAPTQVSAASLASTIAAAPEATKPAAVEPKPERKRAAAPKPAPAPKAAAPVIDVDPEAANEPPATEHETGNALQGNPDDDAF